VAAEAEEAVEAEEVEEAAAVLAVASPHPAGVQRERQRGDHKNVRTRRILPAPAYRPFQACLQEFNYDC